MTSPAAPASASAQRRPRRAEAAPNEVAAPSGFEAFDQLATMVALLDADGHCLVANSALENTLGVSRRSLQRSRVPDWLIHPERLQETLVLVSSNRVASSRFDAQLKGADPTHTGTSGEPVAVHIIVSQTEQPGQLMLEMFEIEQQTRLDREERAHGLAQANKELVRNLAHEIKNPLGGIRGAAQLLEMEVESKGLSEYTQVIIHEADRLQALVDRLLAPQRHARVVADVNIHEVIERVRSLILAEFPRGLKVVRDYDVSIPEFRGDREQLIQAVLNIVRNAAQALSERIMAGDARLIFRTRVARQATFARQRYKLALELHVEDNGPGIPEALRDLIFHPLVSGREGGSGLGLTLAQTFVEQHLGTIECDSTVGRTLFKIWIPLP